MSLWRYFSVLFRVVCSSGFAVLLNVTFLKEFGKRSFNGSLADVRAEIGNVSLCDAANLVIEDGLDAVGLADISMMEIFYPVLELVVTLDEDSI